MLSIGFKKKKLLHWSNKKLLHWSNKKLLHWSRVVRIAGSHSMTWFSIFGRHHSGYDSVYFVADFLAQVNNVVNRVDL